MTRTPPSTGALRALVVSALAVATSTFAQTTEPPRASDQPVPERPIPVEPASEEEPLLLSPFEVNTDADRGYQATSTLAGSRINTKLKDVGSAIQVVTGAFLRDTNSKNAKDLLVLTTNTEVGGIGGNFMGAGNGAEIGTQTQRARPQQNTRVRGLTEADNTRNYFLTDIPWDSYNLDRVEIQRGPNAILFGMGSPAGIINGGIRGADFKTGGQAEFRYGSYESIRGSLDYNQVLLKDELSIRVDGLKDKQKFQQKQAYNNNTRGFVAGRWDPRFLNNDVVRTSLKVNYENGRIRANNPDPTPPIDAITPWFNVLNKNTYDASYAWAADTATINDPALASHRPGVLSESAASIYNTPWVGNMGRIYDNVVVLFGNPNSSTITGGYTGSNSPLMDPDQKIEGLMAGQLVGIRTYKDYALKAKLPGYQLGVYKVKSLTDASIFDFYNNLLGGPNDHQDENWNAANLELTQTYFDNRLGFSAAVDQQNYKQKQEYMFQGFANAITVDINSYLPDGSPNPNVGRPAVASDSGHNAGRRTWRDSFRFTVTGDVRSTDFFEKSSLMARILGHHTVTGLYSQEKYKVLTTNWSRWTTDSAYGELIRSTSGPNRQVATISYLGDSLLNASTASGLHLPAITAMQTPYSSTIRLFNTTSGLLPDGTTATSHWENRQIGIWSTTNGDIDNLYSNGSKTRVDDTARAIVWQGYMFDNTFVPMVGLRKDKAKYYTAGSIPAKANGASMPFSPTWKLPDDPQHVIDGTTKTWGAVLHTPKILQQHLPWGTNLSLFYNRSENFNPQPDRIGVSGQTLPSPEGRTKDYGFTLSMLNERIILRVNRYETRVSNATLDGGVPGGFYMIGDSEAWGYMFAKRAQARWGSFATDYAPRDGQSQAEATAEENAAVAAFLGQLETDGFWKAWNIRGGGRQLTVSSADAAEAWKDWMEGPNSPQLAITGDTLSKGTEFELTARPLDNWDITINASKTKATRLNLAQSVSEWIEAKHAFLEGPAGYLRLWGHDAGESEYLRNKFNNETYSAYQLIKQQEGGNVPELRPWHVNVVSTYRFDGSTFGGAFKGLRVGGAYRWQDKQIVGYHLNADSSKIDVTNPWKSPTVENIDLWIGYEFRFGKRYTWDIQLNAKNMFADKDLIPVSVQPDGTYAQVRIPEETVYSITNTLRF